MPIHVLGFHVTGGFSAEARVFASLLTEAADVFVPTVLHQHSKDDPSAELFRSLSAAHVIEMDFGWREPPVGGRSPLARALYFTRREWAIARVVGQRQNLPADVVYSSQQRWDIALAERTARSRHIPRIVHLHYNPGPWLGSFTLASLLRADYVIANSEFIFGRALGVGVRRERLHMIHNSLPENPHPMTHSERASIHEELALPSGALTIGMSARMVAFKGHVDLLNAFSRIADKHPNAHLVFVGDGPLLADLRARVADCTFAERVRFTGWRNDAQRLLIAFDIFAHPSLMEPFGLSVAEASAAKLPIVAYRSGATPEVVLDGKTGLLAEPGDVQGLAERLSRLIDDRSLRDQLGEAGSLHVATAFSRPSIATAFREFLGEL